MLNISQNSRINKESQYRFLDKGNVFQQKSCTINNIYFGQNSQKTLKKPAFFKRVGLFLQKKYEQVLNKEISPNLSNTINYGGKALLSPLMIMAAAPFTDEKKETVWYSAIINPIQAGFALITSIASSFAANKFFDKHAEKGELFKAIDPELAHFFDTVKNPQGKQNLGKLKNISTIGISLLTIPVTGLVLNWLLPKIIKDPHEHHNKEKFINTVYAKQLSPDLRKNKKIRQEKIYA
jgi:hypothetical protein